MCAAGRTDIDRGVHNNKFRSGKKKKKNIVRIQQSWLEELLVIILTQQLISTIDFDTRRDGTDATPAFDHRDVVSQSS